MRTWTLLVVLVGGSAVMAADDAKTILERAMKAHGGAEKLAKATVQSWKSKGKMVAADMAIEYTANYTMMLPDKMRFDAKMSFGGMNIDLSAATDGKVGWEQANGMIREMAAEKFTEFQHSVYIIHVTQLYPLTDKAYQLTTLPETTIGGQELVGIKVAREGKRDVSLFFDKKTNLLSRARTKVIDEFQRKEVTQETILTKWRDQDGYKVFDKLTIQRDGKDFIVEEFSGQTMSDKGDAKIFVMPEAKK